MTIMIEWRKWIWKDGTTNKMDRCGPIIVKSAEMSRNPKYKIIIIPILTVGPSQCPKSNDRKEKGRK
jgi:hypothetical protein